LADNHQHTSHKKQEEIMQMVAAKAPATIMIVEDNNLSADLLSQTIRDMGYRAVIAKDGLQAMDMMPREKPDLILLDVMMPGMDGYSVCRKLRENENTRLIPIVMITSLSELGEKIKGIEVGADDFLTKPFNDTILYARIRALLRTKYLNEQLENAEVVIESLALSIEAKDPYTEGHCGRIFRFTTILGKHMGLPDDYVRALQRGGYLHDIGKIGIPDTILLKPGSLTPEEWDIMRKHPEIGEKICKPLNSLKLTLPIIRHHHEKWDGSGYPDHLKGTNIPVTARILQVADIFDALSTDRPYRKALPQKECFEIMRKETKKGWWDAEVVEEFITLVKQGKVI
jgi:putative two-component system response regulator